MFSTYKPQDVTILLKDITGRVKPTETKKREELIQSGVHYSEMLPVEYAPSDEYLTAFYKALDSFSLMTAEAAANVSRQIFNKRKGDIVLVSLARAGTPIGILIKDFIEREFSAKVYHYTISIIRGKGIDRNAMEYILERHKPECIQFVDGWTGKGAIQKELNKAIKDYPNVNPGLAVLSDPAGIAEKSGTNDDFLIASSCLNSTVSGLLSRTFCRNDIIGPKDFHGAVFYKELINEDLTYTFINSAETHYGKTLTACGLNNAAAGAAGGIDEVKNICRNFAVSDINFVKPGIGETTRVLLRRVPQKILVHSLDDSLYLGHIYKLAQEKNVPLVEYPLVNYRACGIIKTLSDKSK